MENCYSVLSVTNSVESEKFIRTKCNTQSVENLLQKLLHDWIYEWNDFEDIVDDIREKIDNAHKELLKKCSSETCSTGLQISLECLVLNKLHDHIVPLICYSETEKDEIFHNKCKRLCDLNITAEQLGAPEDYSIPLAAAVVEFASLDAHRSPVEKIHCLCTTFDLVFAELKTAIVEIISQSSDENKIPVVENRDILPILMIVIIKSKLIHLPTNMYYIENFSWKLQEFKHIRSTLSIFKNAIMKILQINEKELRPSSGKVCKDMDLIKVTDIMAEMEISKNEPESLVENHVKRITSLIFTSTNTTK